MNARWITSHFGQLSSDERSRPVKVVGIYADVPARVQATRLFSNVARQCAPVCEFCSSWWSFDVLADSDLRKTAAQAAGAADMIWCSTDACEALPSVVRAWMSEWCPLKQGTESALVALLRCPFSYPIKQSPAAASLTELARTMGMELFMETFDGTIQQPLGVRANPLMRTTRPAPWLHGCSHPSQPRWWGINE